jgi:hypothetical protein
MRHADPTLVSAHALDVRIAAGQTAHRSLVRPRDARQVEQAGRNECNVAPWKAAATEAGSLFVHGAGRFAGSAYAVRPVSELSRCLRSTIAPASTKRAETVAATRPSRAFHESCARKLTSRRAATFSGCIFAQRRSVRGRVLRSSRPEEASLLGFSRDRIAPAGRAPRRRRLRIGPLVEIHPTGG